MVVKISLIANQVCESLAVFPAGFTKPETESGSAGRIFFGDKTHLGIA